MNRTASNFYSSNAKEIRNKLKHYVKNAGILNFNWAFINKKAKK